jgi:DNA-binding transcriptional regulator GbsR (MarR family)
MAQKPERSMSSQANGDEKQLIGKKTGLCRGSYLILGILRASNAADRIRGLTVSEISGFERQSKPNTMHKKIKALESLELISEGVKSGRAKTYYLTSAGAAELPEKQMLNESEGK